MVREDPEFPTAAAFMPARPTLPAMRKAAAGCRGCPLYRTGTQTVFGEGPATARALLVGEQPGDQEDQAGKPFVGPAGAMLDRAMDDAGLDRASVYVTNAVKHFKWEPRGKRRIHSKPSAREINACRPWLEAEVHVVKPAMIVCLGATASQTLMGRQFRLTQHRGELLEHPWADRVLATIHPSALLRMPDEESRRQAYAEFVEDLRKVAEQLREAKGRRDT